MLSPDRIPLGVYIHLPWCLHRCAYCDFNAHALIGAPPADAYVDALLAEAAAEAPAVAGRAAETVFIGGGTPSLFPPEAVGRLLDGVRSIVDVADGAEVTLEANPGSAEAAAYRKFREAGVTRLSVGVQSFSDESLRRLGRIHDAAAARAAVAAALNAGFTGVNLDLMYGLPGQTRAAAEADVAEAVALGVPHISHYQLTVEPGTPLARRLPPDLPDQDLLAAMEEVCLERLAGAGYRRYEISAYAAAGHRCCHNLNYWRYGDYLGLGAGAHGKLTDSLGRVTRARRMRSPRHWMARAGTPAATVERVEVDADHRAFEFVMNGLRVLDGFDLRVAEERAGISPGDLTRRLAPFVADGLLAVNGDRVNATVTGIRYLDSVLVELLPSDR